MASRYDGKTDEELIIAYRDGDTEVPDYICNKYKNLVRSRAKSMYILGAEPEDLIQEGMIGLFRAVRDYDVGRDAGFSTFAGLCISRQMYKAIQAAGRQKAMPLNNYVSLYCEDDDGNDVPRIELVETSPFRNPEKVVLDKESLEEIQKYIDEELSDFERQVLELHITGMGYTEIAKVLGRDDKSTDNALTRIKGKIRKLINSGGF